MEEVLICYENFSFFVAVVIVAIIVSVPWYFSERTHRIVMVSENA